MLEHARCGRGRVPPSRAHAEGPVASLPEADSAVLVGDPRGDGGFRVRLATDLGSAFDSPVLLEVSSTSAASGVGAGPYQPAAVVPWDQPWWESDVTAWIGEHLPDEFRIRRRKKHSWPWSVVVRVRSASDLFWFKEVGRGLGHEPGLTALLARHAPDLSPDVVAASGARLLVGHAGVKLGRDPLLTSRNGFRIWEQVAARYADLQIRLSSVPDLPAQDCRPATLLQRFSGADSIAGLVASLGDGIRESILNLSLNNQNVCIAGGRPVFIDWGGAAVGHPFCGFVTPLRVLVHQLKAEPGGSVVRRVRDAYLEPWTRFAPLRELRRTFAAAFPLGLLCRSVIRRNLYESLPADIGGPHLRKLDRHLDRFAESLRSTYRLGA